MESFHGVIVVAAEVEAWTLGSDVRLERVISYLCHPQPRPGQPQQPPEGVDSGGCALMRAL